MALAYGKDVQVSESARLAGLSAFTMIVASCLVLSPRLIVDVIGSSLLEKRIRKEEKAKDTSS